MSRLRVTVAVALGVVAATWVTWLVMWTIVTNRIGCGPSFVQDEVCWTTERTVGVAALVLSGALAFGFLVARTFLLLIAKGDLGRLFGAARVGAVLATIAVAGALLLAVGDAARQGMEPESAARARCEEIAAPDGVDGVCLAREMARTEAEVFLSRLPAVGIAALAWVGVLVVAEQARGYRSPVSRAHSSR